MGRFNKNESIWGTIRRNNDEKYVITFNVKNNLFRLYYKFAGDYLLKGSDYDPLRLLKRFNL
jgi:hypothetical protein